MSPLVHTSKQAVCHLTVQISRYLMQYMVPF